MRSLTGDDDDDDGGESKSIIGQYPSGTRKHEKHKKIKFEKKIASEEVTRS